ncbi:mini-chromosome maintenance complex-binding protein-like [Mya arenaria]|uniref:mini-chromosome maintenance complex-binding protein-like n=1 Tax=Mya arenaria TaxID=6604 RepID=UPI0022DF9C48|nr:mini-chromosome maintenance complex-binding protein-like [Mya arenaria]XP_052774001.1 mini-chromosome maintenance complex-binding protein-like [Mya arenaria]
MPSIEDWINNPLGAIQNIFDKQKSLDSSGVRDYFAEKLKTKNSITWIPSLNDTSLHSLKANSLVRFRCMVQDMFDPEFYLGSYEVCDGASGNTSMRSGKYKDIAECGANQTINVDSENNVTMDRMTLYCVPVPGEVEWVKKVNSDMSKVKTKCYPSTSKTPTRTKRNLDDDPMEVTPDPSSAPVGQCQGSATGSGDSVGMETDGGEAKRQQTSATRPDAGSSQVPDLNFPLPDEKGPACLVKVYDEIDAFKVNDVVEFVGVLSVDPALARFDNDSEESSLLGGVEENPEEVYAHAPPPSLVPRLHAVLCNRLSHVNPLVPKTKSEDYITVLETSQGEITALREELLSILEHCLLGDRLAAEYILCYLVATVYGRSDAIPLGKFSLNLSNTPRSTSYAGLLHFLISNLVTQTYLLPMSLDNMNKLAFSPKKDYTANRLKSGLLQLAEHTNLVVDETALEPGQLDVNGVRNLSALGNMINWQKVEYDFNFHKQDFHSNVQALVLSEGKSLLTTDCLLPLKHGNIPESLRDHFALLDPRLTEDFLARCRTYLGLAKHMEYSLPDEIQKKIQEDFVNLRKEDAKSMTVDDFHSLLCLTRLLSLSELKASPTGEIWSRAKTMEQQRKQRVTGMPSREQAV